MTEYLIISSPNCTSVKGDGEKKANLTIRELVSQGGKQGGGKM